MGKKEGLATLLFDMLKGFIAVAFVWLIFKNLLFAEIAALSSVLGHDFSIFLKLKGGKGVATTYGVALFFSLYSLIGLVVWLIILKFTKYASLASLFSFALATIIVIFSNQSAKILFIILFILMLARHYQNIIRLIKGEEHKISKER